MTYKARVCDRKKHDSQRINSLGMHAHDSPRTQTLLTKNTQFTHQEHTFYSPRTHTLLTKNPHFTYEEHTQLTKNPHFTHQEPTFYLPRIHTTHQQRTQFTKNKGLPLTDQHRLVFSCYCALAACSKNKTLPSAHCEVATQDPAWCFWHKPSSLAPSFPWATLTAVAWQRCLLPRLSLSLSVLLPPSIALQMF